MATASMTEVFKLAERLLGARVDAWMDSTDPVLGEAPSRLMLNDVGRTRVMDRLIEIQAELRKKRKEQR
jgi:hypothetical protein